MESANDNLEISKNARLSVELTYTSTSSNSVESKQRNDSARFLSDQTVAEDMATRVSSQNLVSSLQSKDTSTINGLSDKRIKIDTSKDQSQKPDDCLLLEYQNHLSILEDLNRLTSRRTKKTS